MVSTQRAVASFTFVFADFKLIGALAPSPTQFVYRGQRNAEWPLTPSVLRPLRDSLTLEKLIFSHKSAGHGDTQIWAEHRLLQLFVEACDGPGLSLPNDSSGFRQEWFAPNCSRLDAAIKAIEPWPPGELFDLLANAQHHGLPTRLLDWSRRAQVAIYFAAADVVRSVMPPATGQMAVWAFDLERRGLMPDLEVIKVPGSTSRNLAPQEGLFTLLREKIQRGLPYSPLGLVDYITKRFAKDSKGCPLWKITVPQSEAPELLKKCSQYGLTNAILFPGYDGAAKSALDTVYSDMQSMRAPLRNYRDRRATVPALKRPSSAPPTMPSSRKKKKNPH